MGYEDSSSLPQPIFLPPHVPISLFGHSANRFALISKRHQSYNGVAFFQRSASICAVPVSRQASTLVGLLIPWHNLRLGLGYNILQLHLCHHACFHSKHLQGPTAPSSV